MENQEKNTNDIGILIHAGMMMIFSGLVLAVTVEFIYTVAFWIGAVVCIAVAVKRYKTSIKKKKNDDIGER